MKNQKIQICLKVFFIILIFLLLIFFVYGFIIEENSAGAGGFKGDFSNVWLTLQTFLNADTLTAIKSSAKVLPGQEVNYISSRTPLIYILNKFLNPFTDSIANYIRSIFYFSLLAPLLFYYCLKIKFPKINNIILIFLASTILLSPYFRTSAYWGLEENFGIVFVLISYLLLHQFFKEKKIEILFKFIKLFILIFTSSLCVYLDQKLLIVPLFCFVKIIFSNEGKFLKLLTFIFYFIFSIPYLYLIFLWGNIIPTNDANTRTIGSNFYLSHLGFSLTIIGFYFLPLFFFKKENIKKLIKSYFKDKINLLFFLIFIIYLLLSIFLDDYQATKYPILGKGAVYKLSLLLFSDILIQKIFIYSTFVFFYFVVFLFLNRKIPESLIIFYFLISSIFIYPILQEYYDPLIIIFVFIFFNFELKINYKNVFFLFIYLLFFLVSSILYYSN
jgi:hypothetical protein